jgi:hypothetical protein
MASRRAGRGRRRALLAMATAVALAAGVRAGWARAWWYAVLGRVALIVLDYTRVADSAHHFTELAGYANRLELRVVDQQGRVFDQLVEIR